MAKLACLLLLASLHAAAQTPVEGAVLDSVTGIGIPGVRVALASHTKTYDTTTDFDGCFHLPGVEEGMYLAGYFGAGYSVVNLETQSRFPIAGPNPVKLEIKLSRLPHLSGRIVDPPGDPVANAALQLNGRNSSFLGQNTDSQGRFEVRNSLVPGVYTLRVDPPPGRKPPDPDPETGVERAWARTWYPGVTTPEAAARITVSPGAELANLDWKLQALPVRLVRGVVLLPDGSPAAKVEVTAGEDPDRPAVRARSDAEGAFALRLVDGDWRISATSQAAGVRLLAGQSILVAGREITGIKLSLAASFAVPGRVVIETPAGVPPPAMPEVLLLPRAGGVNGADHVIAARPDDTGHFRLENLYPTGYGLIVNAPPPGYYLDSIRLGEVELSAAYVEFGSGDLPLAIVMKSNGGAVRGAAQNCALGGVLLVPLDPARRSLGAPGRANCDAHDRFQVSAIRPGEYYAVALAGGSPIQWQSAAYDENALHQAVRVTVRAGEVTTADLHAISPAQ